MNRKTMIILVGAFALTACSFHKAEIDKPKPQKQLTLEDASRIARGNVIDLHPLQWNPSIYEAVVQFPSGAKSVVYIDRNEKFMMAGALFDAKTGQNITLARLKELNGGTVPAPEGVNPPGTQLSAKQIAQLNSTAKFHYGPKDAKEQVLMIVDPQCPYCHRAWPMAMSLAKQGVRVDVAALGFLGPESVRQAAILNASGDEKLLDAVMTGSKPLSNVKLDKAAVSKIENMTNMVISQGIDGVPAFVRHGRLMKGLPASPEAIMAM